MSVSRQSGRRSPRSNEVALFLALAIAPALPGPGADLEAQTMDARSMNEEQRVRHVLARLAYGPRPGDPERVRAIGIQAWIEEQLHPERLDDSPLEARLADYEILTMDFEELRAEDAPVARVALRRRTSALERGMDPAVGGERGPVARRRMRAQILNAGVPAELDELTAPGDSEAMLEVRLLRAVHSERQLLELMVDFWMNHFSIQFGDEYLLNDFEENVVRPLAFGNFHDLLVATAQHSAMLLYLDNWLSSAPEEQVRAGMLGGDEGLVEGALRTRGRAPFLEQAKGLNENYARELMELHTVGVDGGYSQADIIEVARALTGWTIDGWGDRQDGQFLFDPTLHVAGDKTVMGRTITSGGMDEGLQILDMLANHPSTATFVSSKLVRRFVADVPPPDVVADAARTFQETGGDIREVLRTIFTHPTFFSEEVREAKVKKPIEMVASALRATDATIDTRFEGAIEALSQAMTRMGEELYRHEAPDGYPDVSDAWVSTNALFQRLNFSMALARGEIPGIEVDLPAAQRLFGELGYPPVSLEQVTMARRMLTASAEEGAMGGGMMMSGDEMMAGGGEETSTAAESQYMGGSPMMQVLDVADQKAGEADERAIAVALLLGSPDFQKR